METNVEAIIGKNNNVLLSKDTLRIWDLREDFYRTKMSFSNFSRKRMS